MRCSSDARQSGQSSEVIEKTAESRRRPSSPGTQDRDQLRSTPSKRAPTLSIAALDRPLRASVFRSTRATPQFSNACRNNRYFASVFTPVPWADPASQVNPTSIAHSSPLVGHSRGSQ